MKWVYCLEQVRRQKFICSVFYHIRKEYEVLQNFALRYFLVFEMIQGLARFSIPYFTKFGINLEIYV